MFTFSLLVSIAQDKDLELSYCIPSVHIIGSSRIVVISQDTTVSWLSISVKVLRALCFCFELFVIPTSLHFLFEGCILSESVGSIHTIHQLLPVACWELTGCEAHSMAAMLLCLKSKIFKVTEMSQIPFGSIHDLGSCK